MRVGTPVQRREIGSHTAAVASGTRLALEPPLRLGSLLKIPTFGGRGHFRAAPTPTGMSRGKRNAGRHQSRTVACGVALGRSQEHAKEGPVREPGLLRFTAR